MEALSLNKAHGQSSDQPWGRTFMKIYSTFDILLGHQCQFYGNFSPLSTTVDIKRMTFLKLRRSDNHVLSFIDAMISRMDLIEIASRYNEEADKFACKYRNLILNHSWEAAIKNSK